MTAIASDLAMALDPAKLFHAATGELPDPWQATLLRSTAQTALVLASRQSGKSTTAAALGAHMALYKPKSLTLIFSPSQRQSGEMLLKVKALIRAVSDGLADQDSATKMSLENGSRILSLPGESTTVRGFSSPDLVILDEGAYISDDLLSAVSPMLAVGGGRLVAITTPAGARGWFYELWEHGPDEYLRLRVPAADCPRITEEFLAAERQRLSERAMRAEYGVEFVDVDESVFATDVVRAAVSHDVQPLEIEW